MRFICNISQENKNHRYLSPGSLLFHRGDEVCNIFAIVKGVVELVRPQVDGNQIVLQRATPQSILAEASVYSSTYHCDAKAQTESVVAAVSKQVFLRELQSDQRLAQCWSLHLAREVQAARYRSEVLTLKTVARRLDAWLDWNDHVLPPKGQRKNIAEQIGVSPEALYRELAKRK